MATIFLAGSRKFYSDIATLVEQLGAKNTTALTPLKLQEVDDFEMEKKALLAAFQMIDSSDLVYVFAKEGYVGKAVSMEIAYAYAKGKKVVSSDEISELSARALVSKVQSVSELLEMSWVNQ